MIVHSKGCILLSGDAALFLWPYLPKTAMTGKPEKNHQHHFAKSSK